MTGNVLVKKKYGNSKYTPLLTNFFPRFISMFSILKKKYNEGNNVNVGV